MTAPSNDPARRHSLALARSRRRAVIRQHIDYFRNHGRSPEEIARFIGIPVERVLAQTEESAPKGDAT